MDVIVEVGGTPRAVATAETSAVARFETILTELVPQLEVLRAQTRADAAVTGSVARRMVAATTPFLDEVFLTPMIAVAGSVADELCDVIAAVPAVTRAYVNNGGDVALHLCGDEVIRVGLIPSLETAVPDALLPVTSDSPVRGLATSGRGGRSFSLGIADAVTVVATSAAAADAAATLVANAVDLPGHPAIVRTPASQLDPDSDLADRLVTTDVGALSVAEMEQALGRGADVARTFTRQHPDILGAVLRIGTITTVVGERLDPLGTPNPQELVHAAR